MLIYSNSATDKQPYGSYRLDVFSAKANRRMLLYGKPALCLFIDLEVDSRIYSFCERPLTVPGTRPAKVVDFWAVCEGKATFYLFLNPARPKSNSSWDKAYAQFQQWAAENKAEIVEIDPGSYESRRVRYDNWSVILQHLAGHRAFISEGLLKRCEEAVARHPKLNHIENAISDVDAMLVRAGIFKLLTDGRLVCEGKRIPAQLDDAKRRGNLYGLVGWISKDAPIFTENWSQEYESWINSHLLAVACIDINDAPALARSDIGFASLVDTKRQGGGAQWQGRWSIGRRYLDRPG